MTGARAVCITAAILLSYIGGQVWGMNRDALRHGERTWHRASAVCAGSLLLASAGLLLALSAAT